jgi:hypothetical protein
MAAPAAAAAAAAAARAAAAPAPTRQVVACMEAAAAGMHVSSHRVTKSTGGLQPGATLASSGGCAWQPRGTCAVCRDPCSKQCQWTRSCGGRTEVPAPSGTCSLLVERLSVQHVGYFHPGFAPLSVLQGCMGSGGLAPAAGHGWASMLWHGLEAGRDASCGAGIALHIKGFLVRCEAGTVMVSSGMLACLHAV